MAYYTCHLSQLCHSFQFSILLEYCSTGDLRSYLKDNSGKIRKSIAASTCRRSQSSSTTLTISSASSESKSRTPHSSIHDLRLLIIWSYQVSINVRFTSTLMRLIFILSSDFNLSMNDQIYHIDNRNSNCFH